MFLRKVSCILFFVVIGFFFFSFTPDQPFGIDWPAQTYNTDSLNIKKVLLGRTLFYDPILSIDSSISCNSCHVQYSGFTHIDHPLSHGVENRIGTRNSPSLMNLAWSKELMWDGSVHHIDAQAIAPITSHEEMDETLENVIYKLNNQKLYKKLFFDAYGDSIVTGTKFLKALAQFELSLISNNSKYDKVMRGKGKFDEFEQKGYILFKKHCNSCHTEPLFTNHSFQNNGLSIDTTLYDFGRYNVTKLKEDSLKFKIPTLRNIGYSYPYMHDGRFKSLYQVLNHYNKEVVTSNTLAPELKKGIKLKKREQTELIAFLLTLNDKEFVFDKKHSYPRKIFNK